MAAKPSDSNNIAADTALSAAVVIFHLTASYGLVWEATPFANGLQGLMAAPEGSCRLQGTAGPPSLSANPTCT